MNLSYDTERCVGYQCPVRSDCARHLALSDRGPRTPVNDHSMRVTVITAADCDNYMSANHRVCNGCAIYPCRC